MEVQDIKIKKAIVHILDASVGMPILSDIELERQEEVKEFIQKHIHKIVTGDDFKRCEFFNKDGQVSNILKTYSEQEFIQISKNLATDLYNIMIQNVDIPSADFFVIEYELNQERFLAMLKMNYKSSYIHYVETEETTTNNHIIKQKTCLPTETQRLDEAVIINLANFQIKLIEKKFEINGEKSFYLSKYYLGCKWDFSSKQKLNMITKTMDQINKKFYDDDVEKKMEIKETIMKEIEDKGSIEVNAVAEKVFQNNIELKEAFKEKMDTMGIAEDTVAFQSEKTVKKFTKQTIKTDTGIEISVPIEQYKNKEVLEFVNHQDGTISIMIKNVNKLIGK